MREFFASFIFCISFPNETHFFAFRVYNGVPPRGDLRISTIEKQSGNSDGKTLSRQSCAEKNDVETTLKRFRGCAR